LFRSPVILLSCYDAILNRLLFFEENNHGKDSAVNNHSEAYYSATILNPSSFYFVRPLPRIPYSVGRITYQLTQPSVGNS